MSLSGLDLLPSIHFAQSFFTFLRAIAYDHKSMEWKDGVRPTCIRASEIDHSAREFL